MLLLLGSRHTLITVGLSVALAVALIAPAPASSEQTDWAVDVGFLDFPSSGSLEAQRHFLRGVAILHSFGYKQAIAEFERAQELDPDFAMAYWGEALSYNHIFRPALDLDKPREALGKLGATLEERLAKAPTEREKDFLRAVEIHFGENSYGTDTAARRLAYLEAMEEMYETYPGDDEVAAFYAVALIAAVEPSGDDSYRLAVKAGSIGLDIFSRNPDHPGAAHYIIHAFDDPIHARLAFPAAERFAEIAEAVSHARHMPSHIFIQLGMWDRVSRSNDSAYEAALDLWEEGDAVNDMTHAVDWGHYGDLQREAWDEATERRRIMDEIVQKAEGLDDWNGRFPAFARDLMWAREVIERQQWEVVDVTGESTSSIAFGSGLSAVELGDLRLAKKIRKHLDALAKKRDGGFGTYMADVAETQSLLLGARIAVAQGKADRAISLLEEALLVEESLGPPNGTPSAIKPVNEAYGEALLALGRSRAAASQFESSLLRTPNRRLSVRGLEQAQSGSSRPKS